MLCERGFGERAAHLACDRAGGFRRPTECAPRRRQRAHVHDLRKCRHVEHATCEARERCVAKVGACRLERTHVTAVGRLDVGIEVGAKRLCERAPRKVTARGTNRARGNPGKSTREPTGCTCESSANDATDNLWSGSHGVCRVAHIKALGVGGCVPFAGLGVVDVPVIARADHVALKPQATDLGFDVVFALKVVVSECLKPRTPRGLNEALIGVHRLDACDLVTQPCYRVLDLAVIGLAVEVIGKRQAVGVHGDVLVALARELARDVGRRERALVAVWGFDFKRESHGLFPRAFHAWP